MENIQIKPGIVIKNILQELKELEENIDPTALTTEEINEIDQELLALENLAKSVKEKFQEE